MSVKQAVSFAQGLKDLLDKNQEDRKARTEQYAEKLAELAAGTGDVAKRVKEFQDESEDYAKDMVTLNDQLNKDIQALYQETYPEGDEEE